MTYFSELRSAMALLGKHPRTIFLGQTVCFPGSGIFKSLEDVPVEKRLELPVIEDTQLGVSTGLAIAGWIPISIFPRFDFLLCATNQIINHLDKLPLISKGALTPKVIIRTAVGSRAPLHPGLQHCGDYTIMLAEGCKNIYVRAIRHTSEVLPEYEKALQREGSSILIEYGDLYDAN